MVSQVPHVKESANGLLISSVWDWSPNENADAATIELSSEVNVRAAVNTTESRVLNFSLRRIEKH